MVQRCPSHTPCGAEANRPADAQVHGLTQGTLSNWRFRDRLAGRSEAAPGFPRLDALNWAVSADRAALQGAVAVRRLLYWLGIAFSG